ncbi:hypothetical protein [Qipengyuania marisflavi]|uniref:Lipoprotein n=1 Tax=Qipengyuania marisflavi TaxID=2486356 RepID=A0A5S3PB13_9SPHN|nr:hypothetical protein [Qipengyuania marisflavi]TMM48238.1 hypothetical protein FEV51_08075 [Qipengyuania marisflavi]
MMRYPVSLAVSLLISGCGGDAETTNDSKVSLDLERLEEISRINCECRMAGYEDSVADAEYKRLTVGITGLGVATSSVPVSYESVCFEGFGDDACISTGGYVPPNSDDFICTEEQGIALEGLFNAVEAGGGSIDDADKAVSEKLESFRQEARRNAVTKNCR